MIEQARRYCGFSRRVEWQVADAAGFAADHPFSLIISNCALHWVLPIERAFKNLAPQLEPDGQLICSVMLHGTLQELHDTRLHVAPRKKPQHQMPSENEVMDGLVNSGLDILKARVEPFEIAYNSAQAFLRAIHDQGLTDRQAIQAHSIGENRDDFGDVGAVQVEATGAPPAAPVNLGRYSLQIYSRAQPQTEPFGFASRTESTGETP